MSSQFEVMKPFSSGWRQDCEDVASLRRSAVPFACAGSAIVPEEVNHRGWLQIENQSRLSSCDGHATSSAVEVCNYIGTGGAVVQLSRMFAYLVGQQACGLLGQDQGCTIEGGVEGAKNVGSCFETTLPYTGEYFTQIPVAALDEAGKHRIRNHVVMQSYAECFSFLSLGLGALIAGVRWVGSLADSSGIVERLNGRFLGYHAVPLVGYTRRQDRDGRNYLDLPNSWGPQWGDQGWSEIAPRVVDQWFAEGAVVIGVSDLEVFSPRKIHSWKGALSS